MLTQGRLNRKWLTASAMHIPSLCFSHSSFVEDLHTSAVCSHRSICRSLNHEGSQAVLRTSHLQHLQVHPSLLTAERSHLLFSAGVVCTLVILAEPRPRPCYSVLLSFTAYLLHYPSFLPHSVLPPICFSLFHARLSPPASLASRPEQELSECRLAPCGFFIICEITSSLTSVGVKTLAKYFRTLAKPLKRSSFRGLSLKSLDSSAVSSHPLLAQ